MSNIRYMFVTINNIECLYLVIKAFSHKCMNSVPFDAFSMRFPIENALKGKSSYRYVRLYVM
jgi:hypothetical protein